MVVFWSPLDVIVLGAGTRIFGTIDRIKTSARGWSGSARRRRAPDEQQAQYAKLRQVRWGPGMASTGYLGGHVGPDSPAFLRKYVVPLLRAADAPPGLISPGRAVKPGAPPADNLMARGDEPGTPTRRRSSTPRSSTNATADGRERPGRGPEPIRRGPGPRALPVHWGQRPQELAP